TGPVDAPRGTRTSAEVLRRTTTSASTSSPSPIPPWKTTWSARASAVPRTRTSEPGRTVPGAPQAAAQATRAIAGGGGNLCCAPLGERAAQHAATTYAVVRILRPNDPPQPA